MLGRVVVGLWLAILAVVPAAAQDYSRGMEAYRQGDYLTALRNWQPLAEKGDAPSQSSLGFLYNYGHGVERNYREALKWYRKAAEQGFAPAQYHLGFLYTKGLGVTQDYVKAHMWFELGAVGGLSYSDKNRAIVARRMTSEQIAEARELARGWQARMENRRRGGEAEKKAAAKRAAAKRAAAKKAAARKAAAEKAAVEKAAAEKAAAAKRVERRQAASATPKPAAQPAQATPGPVTPVAAGEASPPQGTGTKAPVRKASATVPAAEAPAMPAPHPPAVSKKTGGKAVQTAAARTVSTGPEEQKPARVSAGSPQKSKSSASPGSVLLQLGATKSKDLAFKEIARLERKHGALLGDVKIRAVRKDLGPKGIYYRLRAGPIEDAAAGQALCRKLTAAGQSCLLLKL
jgi:hypothetical protein